ncbi:MAG TPA: TetR family transcriptional regulator C-terminal domain-containing protein [Myxococcota bacterium]|nr:TetR family transcriptional regulator C-terminal domain-containing protein [Myxococcota bacterium]
MRAARHDAEEESAWAHLLLEFRLHAARDPELARRYGDAHRRTIAGVAALIAHAFEEAGETPVESPRQLAVLLIALDPACSSSARSKAARCRTA